MYQYILFVLLCVQLVENSNVSNSSEMVQEKNSTFYVKVPLLKNYSRKLNDRIKLECEFEYKNGNVKPADLTLYWVRNYQEILHPKRGRINIIRRNMTSVLVLKNLETFDSGSYMCVGELSPSDYQLEQLNASSETTLMITGNQNGRNRLNKQKSNDLLNDYLLSDLSNDDTDELTDEFPSLNPTIVENTEDKGFCEPYRGSICADTLTSSYSIYSTSTQQQDQIEERLKSIIPLLNKNNLSKRCSTFAVPSLCLFAFPLCDKKANQPKQICRKDCNQLQQDLCKNEYLSIKSLFESKFSESLEQQSSNFLVECDQLPPSSDTEGQCLPIVSMTYDVFQSNVVDLYNQNIPGIKINKNTSIQETQTVPVTNSSLLDDKLTTFSFILILVIVIPLVILCVFKFCYCKKQQDSVDEKSSTCQQSQQPQHLNPNNLIRIPVNNHILVGNQQSIKSLQQFKQNYSGRAGSSKSSVVSSSNSTKNTHSNVNSNIMLIV